MQHRKKTVQVKTRPIAPSAAPVAPKSVSIFDPSILNSFFPVFFFLLIPRFLAANRAPISDCDETFNFWEAVHHLTFSGGQQTWEQAPQYALRSWLYAGAHAALFRIVGTLVPWVSTPASFWFMSRFALAVLSAAVEAFAAAVFLRECRKMNRIDPNNNRMICGYLSVAFLATAPGLFSHQISLLPTTTAATILLLCTSLTIFDPKYFALVPLLSGAAILLAWPFACVAYAPILLTTLHHYNQPHLGFKRLAFRVVFAAVTIIAASVAADTLMYLSHFLDRF
jgi:alpha-1,2-mannosyltransferase